MTLFEEIKKYAKFRGYNLSTVAKKAGLSENAIYNWKNHTPSKPTIEAVAKVLGVTYSQLTGEDDTEPTKNTVVDLASDGVFMFDGDDVSEDELAMIRGMLATARANRNKK